MDHKWKPFDYAYAPNAWGRDNVKVQIQGFIPGGDVAVVLPLRGKSKQPSFAVRPRTVPVSELKPID
jgi:hypothetical protein